MKIIACVKQVPDSAARVVAENGQVSWGDAQLVINPWDEYAVEAALQQKEAHNGSLIAISIGNENAKEALKHALAMGADEAVLITDPALTALDTQGAAHVLAAAIKKIGEVDLAFFGRQAIDGDAGLTPAQTARLLGWSIFSLSAKIDVEGDTLRVERSTEEGRQIVSGKLPGVFSIVKDFGEPRYPSFMGIRKASRAEIPVWSLADLGIKAPAAVVSWPEVINPPAREISCEMIEAGSPEEIANILADKILAEKIL
ncbi:MAG: electron transfer flavoprotein subunit beta/FixA family protein [Anaerolineales bacterium]|nr:electron transfer flavoprotein subunit beta/FixA family protein [Anaerolineales bacterium]